MPRSKKSTIQNNPLSAISPSINKGGPKPKTKQINSKTQSVALKSKKTSPAKKAAPIVVAKKKKPIAPPAKKKPVATPKISAAVTVAVAVTKKTSPKVAPQTSPALLTQLPPATSATSVTTLAHSDSAKTGALRQELSKKEMANIVIKKWSQLASLVVIAPLPFLATSTSTGLQITMIRDLCRIYNVPFHRQLVKASISSILSSGAGIFTVSFIARELLQSIPYLGTAFVVVTQPTIVYKITESLGGIFVRHFEKNGDLSNLDLEASRKLIKNQANK